MESKALNTIQAFAKIGKVLSAIAYVCCLVGGILCLVGIVGIGVPGSLEFGGVTVHSMFDSMSGVRLGTSYAAMAGGAIICIGGCVISKLAGRYFKNELAAGTPFTFEGACEMLRLGICTAAISLGAAVAAAICESLIGHYFGEAIELSFGDCSAVGLGIAFIVVSVILKYGAEASAGQKAIEG